MNFKNKIKFTLLMSSIATLMACGNLSEVRENGTTEKAIFPKIEEATFKHNNGQYGTWVNWDNVRQIEKGMNKDQIRHLIGHPHFNEGFGFLNVREWDYVFNYRERGEHKICQYKILFDKNMNAQTFLWYPNACNSDFKFVINTDVLFDFDKDEVNKKGLKIIDALSQKIESIPTKEIVIEGYTDRLGLKHYNYLLSRDRAENVKEIIQKHIKNKDIKIESYGYGSKKPLVMCDMTDKEELKTCLAPNRRVEIKVKGFGKVKSNGEMMYGEQGPAPLYEKDFDFIKKVPIKTFILDN